MSCRLTGARGHADPGVAAMVTGTGPDLLKRPTLRGGQSKPRRGRWLHARTSRRPLRMRRDHRLKTASRPRLCRWTTLLKRRRHRAAAAGLASGPSKRCKARPRPRTALAARQHLRPTLRKPPRLPSAVDALARWWSRPHPRRKATMRLPRDRTQQTPDGSNITAFT